MGQGSGTTPGWRLGRGNHGVGEWDNAWMAIGQRVSEKSEARFFLNRLSTKKITHYTSHKSRHAAFTLSRPYYTPTPAYAAFRYRIAHGSVETVGGERRLWTSSCGM